MKAVKLVAFAGSMALAVLIMPVGVAFQWNTEGPSLTTTSAVDMAYAAPLRPATKKPPAGGMPTLTSSGITKRTTGWQTGQGKFSDDDCQSVADGADAYNDLGDAAYAAGDFAGAIQLYATAHSTLSSGMDQGCAFT